MTSSQAKIAILSHLLFDRSFIAAATESFNASDVFGVTKALYSYEYEIKVNRHDLLNELAIVNWLAGKAEKPANIYNANKRAKHEGYLLPPVLWTSGAAPLLRLVPPFVPNYFSFAVPGGLLDLAQERLLVPQYGLVQVDDFKATQIVRTPSLLNKNKVNQAHLLGLMRKCSTESYFARKKLIESQSPMT